ncbi:hypothetical protein BCR32DRAFT_252045 [Anaeromyces robustus]|uniref:Uncharacterized protein n=1 Tax=Anaeromyces robustus TaxID=1754192 RepID=A0A1Y1UL35_9FUNG|nr:hypothetical protein BCR32DRAFT_252045 [Anaeromyces robustus]|eukprot:ORX38773.1 hypothetical protein BCR32DRAFT_252045 [Anaeromyces robustus]
MIKENGYILWYSRPPYSDSTIPDIKQYDYSEIGKIWQYSFKGKIAGISEDVDLDVYYGKFDETVVTANYDKNSEADQCPNRITEYKYEETTINNGDISDNNLNSNGFENIKYSSLQYTFSALILLITLWIYILY